MMLYPDGRAQAAQVLASAAARAGIGRDLDATSYLKDDDDMKLIDGLDPRWSGALPATFLFDAAGQRVRSWLAPITFADVDPVIREQLTKSVAGAKRGGAGGAHRHQVAPGITTEEAMNMERISIGFSLALALAARRRWAGRGTGAPGARRQGARASRRRR